MSTSELLLIDLSGIAHQLYHVSGNETDPSFIANQIVVRVRQLASQHPHTAVCLDSGKSFRHDLAPDYKANRDTENRAVLKVQIDNACATLKADGFPVWAAKGYEADDIIATATAKAVAIDGTQVLIASADKDLCQLVSDRVRIKSTHPQSDGTMRGPAEVLEKFKVRPDQMLDYLCLVGDSSDNVKGAIGIGPVLASELLKNKGTLDAIYQAIDAGATPWLTPARRSSLVAFRDRLPLVRDLIALKSDAPIPFEEIAAERGAQEMDDRMTGFVEDEAPALPVAPQVDARAMNGSQLGTPPTPQELERAMNAPIVPYREPMPPAIADFSLQLEPRTPDEAARLAGHLFKSRLFSAYGTWEGILAVILSGRELGMGAMKSLKTHHIMDGRAVESADLIAGQVLSSGKAVYFRPVRRSDTAVTFKTLRAGEGEEPFELTYTIEEARLAWKKDDRAWAASGWGKNPADMLVARCKSKLARLVYPDVVAGLYSREEFE